MAPNVTVMATEDFQALIGSIEKMELTVLSTLAELKEAKKPYLTPEDLMELTGFGRKWVNDNKHVVGYSMIGGCLRFSRNDVDAFMKLNYFKSKKP